MGGREPQRGEGLPPLTSRPPAPPFMDTVIQPVTDAAECGLALVDRAGRVRLWNDWIARASGIPADKIQRRTLVGLVPGIADTPLPAAVSRALTAGVSSTFTTARGAVLLPLTRKVKGRTAPMEQLVVVKPLPAGGEQCCLIQVFDISLIVRREAQLRRQARALERLNETHSAIVNSTADAIVTFGSDRSIRTLNPAAEAMFGCTEAQVVGTSVGRLIPILEEDGGWNGNGSLLPRSEVVGLRSDGQSFPMDLAVSVAELGGRRLYVAAGHDITARKQAQEELTRHNERLTTLINALPDLICFKDGDDRWLVANRLFLDVAGLKRVNYRGLTNVDLAQLSRGKTDYLLADAESDARVWRDRHSLSCEETVEVGGSTTKVFDVLKIPLFDNDGGRRGMVMVGRDVTERKLAAARIHHIAHHDALTGLPNRVLFQERLAGALAQAQRSGSRVGLLYLDLDKFKDINDSLGHYVGDVLLKAVAQRLLRCVRATDTVARLGGDEFAVLLTNLVSPEGASNVAEAIVAALAEPFGIDGHEITTSTSIGISIHPDDGDDAEQLLRNADLAMFRSKARGRNAYQFFVAEMDAEVQARKVMERELRSALAGGEFALHYQPFVDLKTGRIVGCEALLRWKHPSRGWLRPAAFLHIAERTEMIAHLGRWIAEEACAQSRLWEKAGLPPLAMAINLSAAQFNPHHGLIRTFCETLERTGHPPHLLRLEITEAMVMQNPRETTKILARLRDMGVGVSIDNFGTGLTSLATLKSFPLDRLKIDGCFIDQIDRGQHHARVAKALVGLGRALGASVSVEGVETKAQLEAVTAYGVDEAQGYFLGHPLPADEFARAFTQPQAWMSAWISDA